MSRMLYVIILVFSLLPKLGCGDKPLVLMLDRRESVARAKVGCEIPQNLGSTRRT